MGNFLMVAYALIIVLMIYLIIDFFVKMIRGSMQLIDKVLITITLILFFSIPIASWFIW